jgi:hypothetical protein
MVRVLSEPIRDGDAFPQLYARGLRPRPL